MRVGVTISFGLSQFMSELSPYPGGNGGSERVIITVVGVVDVCALGGGGSSAATAAGGAKLLAGKVAARRSPLRMVDGCWCRHFLANPDFEPARRSPSL